MVRRTKNLVHYCPGSASGSPATMPRSEAEVHLNNDTKHLELLAKAGALGDNPAWPHIGGTCRKCSRANKAT